MDETDIFQGIVTVLGIVAGVCGLIGKSRYMKMLYTIIRAIEEGQHTDSKRSVRRQSIMDGNQAALDCEIIKVTGRRVKKLLPAAEKGVEDG